MKQRKLGDTYRVIFHSISKFKLISSNAIVFLHVHKGMFTRMFIKLTIIETLKRENNKGEEGEKKKGNSREDRVTGEGTERQGTGEQTTTYLASNNVTRKL